MDLPDRFQHFQVLRRPDGSLWELGRGAMGITYKAFDTNLRCDVALKVINAQYLNSETARQRFLREARAAAQLRHPNVASVFHLGNSEGGFFYAMEFVDGETVERKIQRDGPLASDLALRIARQVTRALIAADRQKLVHRDIKPSNIMLVKEDDEDHLLVKVIDFGLAKSLASVADQSLTVTLGGFVGTPHFASPEQLEEKEIDVRSDIYSLGATLWFMLAGRPPFQGSMASVIHQHLAQPVPQDVLLKLKPPIAELLEKMLAKLPEDRFQTPVELKRQLDELLSELRGQTPTLAPLASDPASVTAPETSVDGFSTGQLIRGRYQILGRSEFDQTLFSAKDLHSNRIVTLRPLPATARYDTQQLDLLQQEISRIRSVHHPNLLEVFGLESHDRGLVIVTESVRGFSLQELLRVRRELTWQETQRLVKPLAKAVDFTVERQLAPNRLALRSVFVEVPRAGDTFGQLLRDSVTTWPPFIVKIDGLIFARLSPAQLTEPTQTVVDSISVDGLESEVQNVAFLVYELLGGVKSPSSSGGPSVRIAPLAGLSELGNALLRQGLTEPRPFRNAVHFVEDLEQLEKRAETPVTATAPAMIAAKSASKPAPADSALDDQPSASPWLLRLLTGIIVLLVLLAGSALLVANLLIPRPEPPPSAIRPGSVSLTTKPEGAAVNWNGKPVGQTPLSAFALPSGKQVLEVALPGYQTRPVEVMITDGTINNLGLIPLAREIGQLVLNSEPSGVKFEVIDSEQRVTSGATPQTIDNFPVGKYTVKLKRTGWPDHVQEIDLPPRGSVTVQHVFQGVNVELKSDPAGATIYLGASELGKTPLSVSLPPDPVELVSRVGALAPVTRVVDPNPDGSTAIDFKHDYGIVAVSVERADAEISIGGMSLGKPPVEGIMPPGKHDVVVRVPGMPDQSRTAQIENGKRVAVNFTFGSVPSPAAHRQPAPSNSAQSPGRNGMSRREALRRFENEWDSREQTLERQIDGLDDRIDRAEGAQKDRLEAQKVALERRKDQFDDQREAAEEALKRQFPDD